MATFDQPAPNSGFTAWVSRSESWLDGKGKGAWIAVMVLGFIVFWPVGLALLAYMIWSNKMSCHKSRRSCRRSHRGAEYSTTGNAAFDAYKAETLQRLQDEQENFEAFLQRLRDARDKSEFDQFMDDREKSAAAQQPEA